MSKQNNSIENIRRLLWNMKTIQPEKAASFFKTKKGQYAEEECFIGVRVPDLRKLAKNYGLLSFAEIKQLLQSSFNEERLLALFILIDSYKKSTLLEKEKIYQFYLKQSKRVNNWNLVDSSAHLIIGSHLYEQKIDRKILKELACSSNLWERRIAIVATWYFIRHEDLEWTFKITEKLLKDKEDLIHKACGWMLREAGKKNSQRLYDFLDRCAIYMPRTMLRYAIEKLPEKTRLHYLSLKS